MSGKYSTEELIRIIKNGMLFAEGSKAIIARLRAGEKLYEAAKEADEEFSFSSLEDENGMISCKTKKKLRKAIADYAGKK